MKNKLITVTLFLITLLIQGEVLALPLHKVIEESKLDNYFEVYHKASFEAADGTEGFVAPPIVYRHLNPKIHTDIKEKVAAIHSKFRMLYPNKIKNEKPPGVVILDSRKALGFSPGPYINEKFQATKQTPYMIILYTGLLESSYENIMGTVAHELAHLLLQWIDNQGNSHPQKKYYKSDGRPFYTGETIQRDHRLSSQMIYLNNLTFYSSDFSHAALQGIPYDLATRRQSATQILLSLLDSKSFIYQCFEAKTEYNTYLMAVDNLNISKGGVPLVFEKMNLNNLNERAQKMKAILSDCFKDTRMSFKEVFTQTYGVPEQDYDRQVSALRGIDKKLFERRAKHFENSSNIIEAISSYLLDFRREVRMIGKRVGLKNNRYYNHEDHADEVAIEILHSLGLSITGFNDALLSFENSGKDCHYKTMKNEPYYGDLKVIHHTQCWRSYRNYQYEQKLYGR